MSKTLKTVGITLICLALAGGTVAGGMLLQKNHDEGKIEYPWENTSNNGGAQNNSQNNDLAANAADIETMIKGSGIVLKALTSGVNDQGYATRTFGYTVSPANATDQRVTVSMSWVDSSVSDQISAFFSYSVNSDDKTITIACKQNFGHQALLTITSQSDSSKYGTVTVDCLKKLTGFKNSPGFSNVFGSYGQYNGGLTLSGGYQTSINKIRDLTQVYGLQDVTYEAEDLVAGYTSTYTKDREFTFELTMAAPTSSWTLDVGKDTAAANQSASNPYKGYARPVDGQGNPTPASLFSKAVNFGDSFGYGKTTNITNARAAIQAAIDSLSLDARNELHSTIGGGTYWQIAVKADVNLTVTCNETGDSKSYPVTVFYTDSPSNYSFLEPVTSVEPDVTGIDF